MIQRTETSALSRYQAQGMHLAKAVGQTDAYSHVTELLRLCDHELKPMLLALLERLRDGEILNDRSSETEIVDEFLARLCRQYQSLTPAEIQLCVLLRFNMSTSVIAAELGLSRRSVESYRYRIRRKLDLPQGTSLVAFLASI